MPRRAILHLLFPRLVLSPHPSSCKHGAPSNHQHPHRTIFRFQVALSQPGVFSPRGLRKASKRVSSRSSHSIRSFLRSTKPNSSDQSASNKAAGPQLPLTPSGPASRYAATSVASSMHEAGFAYADERLQRGLYRDAELHLLILQALASSWQQTCPLALALMDSILVFLAGLFRLHCCQ